MKNSCFQSLSLVVCAVSAPALGAPSGLQKTAKPAQSSTRSWQITPRVSPFDKTLNPNRNLFPDSSLHDFSAVLPNAARGFLGRRGAYLRWENGTRAKFWGINVANTTIQQSDRDIDAMLRNFRRAGFNLVRLHHFDERGGIIDLTKNDSRHLVESRLRKLDYWIFRAQQNGISVYLDLLDYRRFKAGDGVPNAEKIGRAARPYNVFDPKLIELQREYARMLLRDHVNFYNGKSYADDPTVVMLEIYDESGLFMKRGVWREMPPPYAANFQKLWNDWLRGQYTTSEKLRAVWGNRVLDAGESLENDTVEVPALSPIPQKLPPVQRKWAQAARRNDGARFAHDVHTRFLRDMRNYLREIGVKIPVSTVGRFDDLADLKSIAQECDFSASNFYFDHPYWAKGKPAWTPPSFFHNRAPLQETGEKSFAWSIAQSHIKNLPLVVREWNNCWPNPNRASGIVEAASYAALHDVDAMILFGYETAPNATVPDATAPNATAPNATAPTAAISYFNVRSDVARWGLCAVASQVFLGNLVRVARNRVVVPFNDVDVFSYDGHSNAFYGLAQNTIVENDFYDETYRADAMTKLILTNGRSGIGFFEGAPALLQTRSLARDLYGRNVGAPQYLNEYKLTTQNAAESTSSQSLALPQSFTLPLSLLRLQRRETIGADEANDSARGFVDRARKRLVFGTLGDREIVPAARQALKMFGVASIEYSKADANDLLRAVSDSGEIRRDARRGQLLVDTPQFQAICGAFDQTQSARLSSLRVENGRGVLVALSLDGLPLKTSRRWMLKNVTNARNEDQKTAPLPTQRKLSALGKGPVKTDGRISSTRTRVWLNGQLQLEIALDGGAWELQFDNGKTRFWCDTPNVPFRL